MHEPESSYYKLNVLNNTYLRNKFEHHNQFTFLCLFTVFNNLLYIYTFLYVSNNMIEDIQMNKINLL